MKKERQKLTEKKNEFELIAQIAGKKPSLDNILQKIKEGTCPWTNKKRLL